MKKILSVLSFILIGLSSVHAATFYANASAQVATEAQGMGKVCVTTSATAPAANAAEWSEWLSSTGPQGKNDGNNTSAIITFYYYAQPAAGYYFAGWSTIDGGTDIGAAPSHSVTVTAKGTITAPTAEPTLYAMFKPYINVVQHDKMIHYVSQEGDEYINNATILVEAQAKTITFALSGGDAGLFALVNPLTAEKKSSLSVTAKDGCAQVMLSYLGNFNNAIGKTVNVVITAGDKSRTITTTIEDMPTLTFLPAKGAYTVKHINRTERSYTVAANAATPTITQLTDESMQAVELKLNATTSTDGYAFIGWQEITQDANGNDIVKYISYDQNVTYNFKGSAQVRPQFVKYDEATFYIQSQKDKKIAYSDFSLALKEAESLYLRTGVSQVLIFESVFTIRGYTKPSAVTVAQDKEATLAAGDYTIPKGITLLIPGDANRTVLNGDVTDNEFVERTTFALVRKLNVADNTKIIINGNLSVYAKLSYAQGSNGCPTDYGQIDLGANNHIVAKSGAILTVYGYITGDPNNSSVTLESGAIIHEAFQIKDWRGGTALIGDASKMALSGDIMNNNKQKVFPAQQYYVQNVETRLILKHGAQERLGTAVYMQNQTFEQNANLVLPSSSGGEALFKIGEGVAFIKYYDRNKDRIKFIIQGETPTSAATMDVIGLKADIVITSVDIKSSSYVLPICNNMDVSILNATVSTKYDMSLLAGSSLYVGPSATFKTTANFFIYDSENHVVSVGAVSKGNLEAGKYNYFAAGNAVLCPLTNFPTTRHAPTKVTYKRATEGASGDVDTRTITDVSTARRYLKEDATLKIDGYVEGKIFTTNGTYNNVDHYANITSNGGGKIKVTTGSNTTLYQVVQHKSYVDGGLFGSGYLGSTHVVAFGEIPNTVAKLHNADGTYTSSSANDVYVYDGSKWVKDGTTPATPFNNNYTPTFTLSSVSPLTAKVGASANAALTATTSNANVAWADVDWSYRFDGLSADQFALAWGAKPAATVTFAPTSVGTNKAATLTVTASYVKNQILYTHSETINLTGVAQPSANDLAFAISATTTTPQTLFQNGNGAAINITNAGDLASAVTLQQSGNNWTITANENVNTAITIHATQAANGGVAAADITKTIIVGKGRTPLQVPITATSSNFANFTWSKSANVAFNNGVSLPVHSQWTAFFTGTPDKLKFTPSVAAVLQIEEFDGKNWTIIHPWNTIPAGKEFAIALNPAASKVRIKSANTAAVLANLKITALTDVNVTANVDTLFIPMATAANPSVTREVLFTYQSENLVKIYTSNSTTLAVQPTVFDPAVDNYKQQLVTLTSTVTEPGEYRMVAMIGSVDSQGNSTSREAVVIPIFVYEVPQMIPILLANDADKYRFYYVASSTQHTEWDAKTRTATMKNMPGTSAPSITFAFEGAPTYLGFNASTCKGVWHVEQSADGNNWKDATTTSAQSGNNTAYKIDATIDCNYIRLTYESLYAEDVTLSDIRIVGEASVVVDPLEMELWKDEPKTLTITAVNLATAPTITPSEGFTKGAQVIEDGALGANSVATITVPITYTGDAAIKYGTLTISYGDGKTVIVQLTGLSSTLNPATGIWSGVNPESYTIEGSHFTKSPYSYHEVNIANAYANGNTLFDYLIIYGETKPASGTKITIPTSSAGSNAVTPCFIYKAKADKTGYELHRYEENVNTAYKILIGATDRMSVSEGDIDGNGSMDVYITGFCPYASTGYTKAEDGVWNFQAKEGETLNIYLEDAHIYSRCKTEDGHPFQSKQDGNSFSESYVRGSGAVLVFECDEMNNLANPFKVNIHTRGNNVLMSNHGCFFDILGYRAYQVSSPVQIRMTSGNHVQGSKTELTFDDIWPNSAARTNGYLALKKQVNNAPSIDMGNPNTVVNFRGGQVHLENAQIVSNNYQTTLAICYRSGNMGGINFHFAHGIGTDDVGGTVNFYDGTTTVESMTVDAKYRQYYLMDTDANGNELTTTSCLRLPEHTYVYGGSHCMMRACQHTTSKGGAPSDGTNKLGLYRYPYAPYTTVEGGTSVTHKGGWEANGSNGLVTPTSAPNGYNVESVTPNTNGTPDLEDDYLNFWVTEDYDTSVKPEVDMDTRFWAACMTKISAEMGGQGGSVGGETFIADNTEVQNMLYCKIDEYIYDAITADNYQAPVQVPSTSDYQRIPISVEGYDEESQKVQKVLQNYVTNETDYVIKDRVYYVTTATADMWMTFTPPFDVENVYVIETYSEKELQKVKSTSMTKRQAVMKEQAKHNADFAAFYGVSMALYSTSSIAFWDICDQFIAWAMQEDKNNKDAQGNPLYSNGTYGLRGKYLLQHYDGTNAAVSNYYLYENAGNWTIDKQNEGNFTTQWRIPDESDGVLMNKGVAYSMLFPYCTGCGAGNPIEDREFWDYWSGKFIIFESVAGATIKDVNNNVVGHTIKGSNFVAATDPNSTADGDWVFEDFDDAGTDAIVTGNSTFSLMSTTESELYVYQPDVISYETFYRNVDYESDGKTEKEQTTSIHPTTAFLLATPAPQGNMPARSISRTGEIDYGKQNTPTGNHGGNIPTVGGGNDLFITSTATGINIAVAEPQYVRVLSSTGAVLYSGMVQTAVDVFLPAAGVYVVAGDNEVHKILH